MLAIKGTDKNMQCRGFQYELGKTYKKDKEPMLCKQGFHACLNPYDVLDYYPNMEGNRFFLVELGGMIAKKNFDYRWGGDSKVASNEITFLREVTVDDFPQLFEEFLKDKERLDKLKFIGDLACVKLDCKTNYVNTQGNLISEQWFDYCCHFYEGFACVKLGDKWNYINTNGELLSKQWFDWCGGFNEGFGCVKLGDKWNYINDKGEYLSEQWFDDCWSFSKEGTGFVVLDGEYYKINAKGELIKQK